MDEAVSRRFWDRVVRYERSAGTLRHRGNSCGAACCGTRRPPLAQTAVPVVYVIAIEGTIDLGLARFLSRTIREADAVGAAAVLLEINTFGGRVDAAVAMRDTCSTRPFGPALPARTEAVVTRLAQKEVIGRACSARAGVRLLHEWKGLEPSGEHAQ